MSSNQLHFDIQRYSRKQLITRYIETRLVRHYYHSRVLQRRDLPVLKVCVILSRRFGVRRVVSLDHVGWLMRLMNPLAVHPLPNQFKTRFSVNGKKRVRSSGDHIIVRRNLPSGQLCADPAGK